MSKLHYSPDAKDDLIEINEYISVELANPGAACRMVAYISKRIRSLEQFPEMGASLSLIVGIDTNFRFLVCKNYLVFYYIEGNDVFISRVLYGGRDYIAVLFGEQYKDEAVELR